MKELPKLQGILELLSDGTYHSLDELQAETGLGEKQVREVVSFLTEYGFAEMNPGNEKVRISNDARKLLAQTTT